MVERKDEQIESRLSEQSIRRRERQQESRQQEFIKGPLPLPWMIAATVLPGRYPLAVALVIRFRAGLEKTDTKLRLTSKMLKRFGINRQAGYRALATLEDAGLVTVDRNPGRCPLVSIREKRTKRKTKGK